MGRWKHISCCCPAETWFVSEVTETGIVSEACFDPRISNYLAFLPRLLIADDDSDDDVKDDASETWFVSEVMSEYWWILVYDKLWPGDGDKEY